MAVEKSSRKKVGEDKAETTAAAASKPAEKPKAAPIGAPEKDANGIYTLKPPPSG